MLKRPCVDFVTVYYSVAFSHVISNIESAIIVILSLDNKSKLYKGIQVCEICLLNTVKHVNMNAIKVSKMAKILKYLLGIYSNYKSCLFTIWRQDNIPWKKSYCGWMGSYG